MIDPSAQNVAYDGDIKITFSSGVASGTPNFVKTGTDENYTVTLENVIIQHYNTKDGTMHQIETDLVYRVKATSASVNPGGIGEFSVLMDSPFAGESTGEASRITMYGNVFVGPGTYAYTDDTYATPNPAGADALVLGGQSYYTQKGDYMVVFGNIVLKSDSVLNIMSGQLTVFGDIIIEEDAAFLCNGVLYMPQGNKPGTSSPYGIYYRTYSESGLATDTAITSTNMDSTTYNVVPSSLLETDGIKRLTEENYNDTLKLLNLIEADPAIPATPDNDGILKKIMDPDAYEGLQYLQEEAKPNRFSYCGVQYGGTMQTASAINKDDMDNCLVFACRKGTDEFGNWKPQTMAMQDGANLNATVISLSPISFLNGKNILLSQLGSDVFNMLTASSTDIVNYPEYSNTYTNTHMIKFKYDIPGEGMTDEKVEMGSFFVAGANTYVNDLLSYSTSGNSAAPIIETAVGYANWVKD